METIEINGKQYQLDIEKATERGLLKEKDNKPRSWEEFEKTDTRLYNRRNLATHYNVNEAVYFDFFNSTNEAKAFCALGKLIQLRDAWWGDWRPDWSDETWKYCIYTCDYSIVTSDCENVSHILSFPTEKMAYDFLETFKDLIEQAKMFL